MSSSQELYNRLSETVSALVKVTNRKQLANWLWIVVGLLQGNACLEPDSHLPADGHAGRVQARRAGSKYAHCGWLFSLACRPELRGRRLYFAGGLQHDLQFGEFAGVAGL